MRTRRIVAALLLTGVAALGVAGPAQAATGTETFRLIFVGSFTFGASNTGTVVASGPIVGIGEGVNSGFIPDANGGFTGSNVLRFPSGQLGIAFSGVLTSVTFDPRTCVTHIVGHGTWSVASSTGSLSGTSGSGTFDNDVTLIGRRTATGCSTEQTELSRITLVGPVQTP